MSKDIAFSLDTNAAQVVLQNMAMPLVQQSANAIAGRAQSMATSISSDPPEIKVTSQVGTIRRGKRAIATVSATGNDAHENYIGHQAIVKAKDAGRIK